MLNLHCTQTQTQLTLRVYLPQAAREITSSESFAPRERPQTNSNTRHRKENTLQHNAVGKSMILNYLYLRMDYVDFDQLFAVCKRLGGQDKEAAGQLAVNKIRVLLKAPNLVISLCICEGSLREGCDSFRHNDPVDRRRIVRDVTVHEVFK